MKKTYFKILTVLLFLLTICETTKAQVWTNYTSTDGLIDGIIYSIVEDQNNDFWFGTWSNPEGVNGLAKYDGTNWTQITTTDGLVDEKVLVIFEDSIGNIWIGTFNGLSKYDGVNWTSYTTADGLVSEHVTSIIEDSNGDMWFGTRQGIGSGGVSKFDGTTWTNYTVADGLVSNEVSTIIQDNTGNYWFCTFNGGVSKFDGVNTWTSYTTADGLAANDVFAMIQDKNNNFWFTNYSNAGLSKFDGTTWTTYTTADGLLENRHRAIFEDNAGNLWFGGNSGINMFDGNDLHTYTTADGLLHNGIRAITQDSQGKMWFGTWNGVSMLDLSIVPIPDPNFEQALIDLGIDSDGVINTYLLKADAETVSWLDISNSNNGYGIQDLTGIEAFINLTGINCNNNQIASLNFSANSLLRDVYANECGIQAIDVTNNPELRILHVYLNQISEIDLSNNLLLEELIIQSNNISELDLSVNTNLRMAFCAWNQLTSLNIANGNNVNFTPPSWTNVSFGVDGNPDLQCIQVDANILYNIPADWLKDEAPVYSDNCNGVQTNWGIAGSATPNGWGGPDVVLNETENKIFEATVELTDGLIKFRRNNNWGENYGDLEGDGILDAPPSAHDISVSAGKYNVVMNLNDLTYSLTPYIPNLGVVGSATPNGWLGPDVELAYNEDLNTWTGNVNLTDGEIKFRYENNWDINLGDNGLDNILDSGGANIPVTEGLYFVRVDLNDMTYSLEEPYVTIPDANFEQALIDLEIDSGGVVNQSILRSDVEAVTDLNVNNKNIETLNGLEAFINLSTLYCQYNQLQVLDVTKNTSLTVLECEGNQLTELNVTQNPILRVLGFGPNNISEIDVSKNLNLEAFWSNGNNISTLNLDNNPLLAVIGLSNNPLEHLSIRNGNNQNIIYSVIKNVPNLSCINVDNETADNSNLGADAHITFSEDCGDFVYIPDANFEQALIDLEIDSDGVVNTSILRSDAENTTELNARFPTTPWGGENTFADERLTITEKIQDLTGIEAFINLGLLALEFNALTSIDVSNNTKLKDLIIGGNSISTLDLTANALLEYLNCNFNPIASLDVSLNPNIRELSLDNLLITDIDLSNNLKLESFWASNMNDLNKIDFSLNTLLRNVLINGSNLEALDLSNNASLSLLFVNNNPLLAHLDLRNGNNANLFNFNVANNPILGCINADPIISQSMMSSGETFSEDCGDFVYIPDPNFEQSLIDIGVDTDGVVNTSILREDAETITSLNLNNSLFTPEGYGFNNPAIVNVSGKISDLTGIEAFINLTNLQVSYSELETVNVSANVLLEELWITDGILTGIDVTSNTNLLRLGVMRNNITGTVDVSQNTLLEWLFIYYNSINTIDLSNNPNLWNLWVNNNALTSLDISLNLNLQRLDVQYNPGLNLITNPAGYTSLTSANLSGIGLANYNLYAPLFPNLQWLLLNDNNLTRFNGNNALLVENLFLNNNGIDKLDLSSNIALKQVRVNNNVLTELDLRNGNNIDLTTLTATGNLLTCISVDNPTEVLPYSSWNIDLGVILSANCSAEAEVVLIPDSNFEIALGEYDTNGLNGNILLSDAESITNLNVSNASIIDLTGIEAFVNLIELNVSDNLLDTINLIENVNLIDLDVSSNSLAELNVYSGKNLLTLNVSSNQFQTIDVSSFSNLTVFDSTSNPNLLCIGVNDPNTIPESWTKDDWSAYSNNPDCIEPIIVAKNVVIYLDGNKGQATVDPRAFDDGSSDNVTTNANLIFNLEVTDFTCINLGLNTIELEVMDEAGNSAFEMVNLYVEDNISPTVIANNPYTYDLNGMSAYTITAEDVVKSSSDNCSDPILSIDQSIFTSTGTFTVTLTAEDSSGNTAEDTIDITIEDSADGAGSAGLSFKRNLNLTVFPVPFTDVINIDFSKATDLNTVSVVLFDFNMNETSITFSPNAGNLKSSFTGSLQTGLYILQVTVGSETKTATIVKGGN